MADQGSNEYSSTSDVLGGGSNSVVELNIKTLDSQTYSFQVDKNITVSLFKEKIANEVGVPVGQQRLIFRGRVLKDDHPLSEYHLENGHTLHLIVRQPTQPQSSSGANSGEANTNNGSQGNDASDGAPRSRGQISHSVVLGTFNVGDHVDGAVPDISRVIGAVLNSFGIGSQPANNGANGMQVPVTSNASGQVSGPNVSDETLSSTGVQSQAGNQSQSGQASTGQPFQTSSRVVQNPFTMATAVPIPIPTIHTPIPDSLDTLLEFINRLGQTLRQNGYQPETSSADTEDLPSTEIPRNARGFATAEALSVVMRSAQRLLSSNVLAALSHIAGRLERDGASSDPAIRGQVQSEATQIGLSMQHLGSLLLELGRTLLTLRMGQSPDQSYVNAGPAVYISSSGPNPIMVQPFPLQTSSLFGAAANSVAQSIPTAAVPIGVGTAPRHINIHIHAGTALAPTVSAVGSRQNTNDDGQRDHDNNIFSTGPENVQVFPVRNAIPAAAPSLPVGVAISTSVRPGVGVSVSQAPHSSWVSAAAAEADAQTRELVLQRASQGAAAEFDARIRELVNMRQASQGRESTEQHPLAGRSGAEEFNDSLPRVQPGANDLKPLAENSKESGNKEMGRPSDAEDVSSSFKGESSANPIGDSTNTSKASSDYVLRSSVTNAPTEDTRGTTPLGLGLGGSLDRKKRSKQPKLLGKSEDAGTSASSQDVNLAAVSTGQQLLQSLLSGSSSQSRAVADSTPSTQQPADMASHGNQVDVSSAVSQVLESPALDGLLAGISGQTGVGSSNVLRNMFQQFTRNPQIMNTVQQIAQQVDGREIENMLSGGQGGGGMDLSRMVQQMMPLVAGAFGPGPTGPQSVSAEERQTPEQRCGERAIECGKSNDQPFQVNIQPVIELIERADSPVNVFRAMVETASRIPGNGGSHQDLVDELSDNSALAREYVETLRRDFHRRQEQGDSDRKK